MCQRAFFQWEICTVCCKDKLRNIDLSCNIYSIVCKITELSAYVVILIIILNRFIYLNIKLVRDYHIVSHQQWNSLQNLDIGVLLANIFFRISSIYYRIER